MKHSEAFALFPTWNYRIVSITELRVRTESFSGKLQWGVLFAPKPCLRDLQGSVTRNGFQGRVLSR